MRITQISLGRTYNLGNYENIKPEITAELGDGEDPQKGFELLKEEFDKFYQKHIR